MSKIEAIKSLTLSEDGKIDAREVQKIFPKNVIMINTKMYGPLDTPVIKDLNDVLLKAILELEARLTKAGL